MSEGLSYLDTARLLERLGPLADEIVLIGGQAVHFWVDRYAPRDPFLASGAFTSKDVDFCGDANKARAVADVLGGTVRVPMLDDATAQTGLVLYTDPSGAQRQIDFLERPFGVKPEDVRRLSLSIKTGEGETRFRVLSPVLCLESRVSNLGLPEYGTQHAMRQLRASIICCREYLRDVAFKQGARSFLSASERIYRFTRRRREARILYDEHAVDALDAVPRDMGAVPGLETFYARRLPQMREILEHDRTRRARDRETRAQQRAEKAARA